MCLFIWGISYAGKKYINGILTIFKFAIYFLSSQITLRLLFEEKKTQQNIHMIFLVCVFLLENMLSMGLGIAHICMGFLPYIGQKWGFQPG